MKRFLIFLALLLVSSCSSQPVDAQCNGVFPANTVCGNLTGSAAPPSPQSFSAAGVSTITASDSTLKFAPTSGNVLGAINLAQPNTWTATQVFPNGSITAAEIAAGAASSNVGTLGGVLSGTLPNPSFVTGVVSNAALSNMPADTVKCNNTAGATVPADCISPKTYTYTFIASASAGINDQSAVSGSQSTYWTSSGPAIVHRMNRLLVGPAALEGTGCPSSPNSWMNSIVGGSCDLANIVIDSTSFDGIQAGGRTSVTCASGIGCPSGGSAGAYLFGYNDDNTQGNIALGSNSVGFAKVGSKGIVLGAQQDIDTNAVPGCVSNPNTPLCATGSTAIALLLTPGAFASASTQNPNAAMIINNGSGAKFTKGLIFNAGVLDGTQGTGGAGVAVEMAAGQTLRWYNGTTVFAETGTTSIGVFSVATNSAQWTINGVATVSCSGVTAASVVVTNGIVTHC